MTKEKTPRSVANLQQVLEQMKDAHSHLLVASVRMAMVRPKQGKHLKALAILTEQQIEQVTITLAYEIEFQNNR